MCVVIDADTFSEVTNGNNKEFEALRNWISKKRHTVIHGGSEYSRELSRHSKFRTYLRGLEHAGITYKLDDQEVDTAQAFLEQNFVSAVYDDHHIVAILFVSGCKVVSSHDRGFHRLIQECCSDAGKRILGQLPKLMVNKPKIYQDKRHESFLNDGSVSHCCV